MAFLGQASIHLPHLLQNNDTFPVLMSSREMANRGQTSTHLKHSVQALLSILTVNGVTLFDSELTAPSGQRKLHWVLFLVITGNTTTNPPNNVRKTPALAADSTDVTCSNSVTALKGQIQSQ
jgi:hypothetical protein